MLFLELRLVVLRLFNSGSDLDVQLGRVDDISFNKDFLDSVQAAYHTVKAKLELHRVALPRSFLFLLPLLLTAHVEGHEQILLVRLHDSALNVGTNVVYLTTVITTTAFE